MAENNVSQFLTDIDFYKYNPAGIQRAIMSQIKKATNGEIEIVDPTNPFVFCCEATAVCTAAAMIHSAALTRQQYPLSAQTQEDLYRHMSDKDYADRFARPADAFIAILLPLDELLAKMVLDTTTGIKKIVFARNTFITVGEVPFSIQYPIEIRQYIHGGLQVVYDAAKVSPLQALETNVIEHTVINSNEEAGVRQYVQFEIPMKQFSIVSQQQPASLAIDWQMTLDISDQFYYARVYVKNGAGQWTEITTTHSAQVYDPLVPTAVLRVIDKQVVVSLPQIYTNSGLVSGPVRVDIYQTKGVLEMALQDYASGTFVATFQALDVVDETIFTAPARTLTQMIIFSPYPTNGGASALTFEALRERVIKNAIGPQDIPITNVQIVSALDRQGYDVVKNIDNVTGRAFLATKNMPAPSDTKLVTAAAATIETVELLSREAILIDTVYDNGSSITIMPDTIYKTVNGLTRMVPSQEVTYLLALPAEKRALAISQANYLFSPFTYVLDTAGDEFESRPYYLDDPEALTKNFIGQNDTTMMQVGIDTYVIYRDSTGYKLRITTRSGNDFKELPDFQVHVQLAYVPTGERDRAYLLGTLIDLTTEGERIFEFDLSTRFNVDKSHNLILTKFSQYIDEERNTAVPLVADFDVIFSTSVALSSLWQEGSIDAILGRFQLPNRIAGITHETLRIRFGYALRTLWAQARSVIESVEYEKWDADVPATYPSTIYERDGNGIAFSIVSNAVVYNVLHAAGSPVLDADGEQVYKYRIGDVKLDSYGEPIPLNARDMARQVDVFLIEGAYWFATDTASQTYKKNLTLKLVDWMISDLAEITKVLLDQTRLYFYPKKTTGTVEVLINGSTVKSIEAGQVLVVNLYVSAAVYSNLELRERLTTTTVSTVDASLKSQLVSIDSISTALRASYGNEVKAVSVTGLGGAQNLTAFTVIDDSQRCSIRRRLRALPDDKLIVEEAVTVEFLLHELSI